MDPAHHLVATALFITWLFFAKVFGVHALVVSLYLHENCSQLVERDRNWSKIGRNWSKIGRKLVETGRNWSKLVEMVEIFCATPGKKVHEPRNEK
jgi:predicted transcriptional regulator